MVTKKFSESQLNQLQEILDIKLPKEAFIQVLVSPYQDPAEDKKNRPVATERLFITRTAKGVSLRAVDKTRAGLIAAADQP